MAAFDAGEISMAAVYIIQDGMAGMVPSIVYDGRSTYGIECLIIFNSMVNTYFYWTADVISTDEPVGER